MHVSEINTYIYIIKHGQNMKPTQVKIEETTFEVEHYENDLFLNFETLTLIMPDGYQKFRDLAIRECSAVMTGEHGSWFDFDEDTIKEYMHTYMQQFVEENIKSFQVYVD